MNGNAIRMSAILNNLDHTNTNRHQVETNYAAKKLHFFYFFIFRHKIVNYKLNIQFMTQKGNREFCTTRQSEIAVKLAILSTIPCQHDSYVRDINTETINFLRQSRPNQF